jgi:hypothetical protein
MMLYSLTVERKPEYLHVKVTGDNTPQTVLKYLTEVHNACSTHKCSDVLIEENLEGPSLEISDIYAVISERSKNVHPVVDRIAYVDVNGDHDSSRMKFAETVAVNRGVNVRIFADVREAANWLTSTRDTV